MDWVPFASFVWETAKAQKLNDFTATALKRKREKERVRGERQRQRHWNARYGDYCTIHIARKKQF